MELEESPITQNEKEIKIEKTTRKFGLFSVFITCFIVLICILFIQFQVRYEIYEVIGVSMQPTLNKEGYNKSDLVYVNKFGKIKRNDIIVLDYEKEEVKYIVKRVIAIEGDIINIVGVGEPNKTTVPTSYKSYRVMLNGQILDEPYLDYEADPDLMQSEYVNFYNYKKSLLKQGATQAEIESACLTISDNSVFVLGDNRVNSTDSSSFGEMSLNDKIGRVDFIVYHGTSNFSHFIKRFTYLFIFK